MPDDSKATSGYLFSIAGGSVSWKSKKQTIVAQSTMEFEMIALTTTSEEEIWQRNFLTDTALWERQILVVIIHFDIITTIAKV